MQILSTVETGLWCQQHEVVLNEHQLPDRSDADARFRIPEDAQYRVNLVSSAMQGFVNDPTFLVLFDDWSVWPSGQRMHVFDRFRLSYGETRPLIESPGHVFDKSEMDDAISFVTLAVLFLWDCHVVTPRRARQLFFSHDEIGYAKGIDLSALRDLQML